MQLIPSIKVSIIVPVYNVEQYLRKCLDSIVYQALSDIEIICVNDCSTDNSFEILKEYADKDNRIKIIDFKENKGVAIARNTALAEAKGEYIGFVDSDDFIDLDFYDKLYLRAKESDAEVVKGNISKTNDPQEQLIFDYLHTNIRMNKAYFFCMFTTAIYKKSLLDKYQIRFPENIILGEDRLLPVKAAILTNKLEVVDDTYYHYITRKNSATFHELTVEKINSLICVTKLVFDFINSVSISIDSYEILVKEFWVSLIILITRLENAKNLYKQGLEDIYNIIKNKKIIAYEYNEILYSFLQNNDFKELRYNIMMLHREIILTKLRKNHIERLLVKVQIGN